jgi:hypothetical protein
MLQNFLGRSATSMLANYGGHFTIPTYHTIQGEQITSMAQHKDGSDSAREDFMHERPVGLKVAGVYSIPHECGKEHIRQTGRSTQTRCKEHTRFLHLYQPEKKTVV